MAGARNQRSEATKPCDLPRKYRITGSKVPRLPREVHRTNSPSLHCVVFAHTGQRTRKFLAPYVSEHDSLNFKSLTSRRHRLYLIRCTLRFHAQHYHLRIAGLLPARNKMLGCYRVIDPPCYRLAHIPKLLQQASARRSPHLGWQCCDLSRVFFVWAPFAVRVDRNRPSFRDVHEARLDFVFRWSAEIA